MAQIKRKGEEQFSELQDRIGKIVVISGSSIGGDEIEFADVASDKDHLDDLQIPTKVTLNAALDQIDKDIDKAISKAQHNVYVVSGTTAEPPQLPQATKSDDIAILKTKFVIGATENEDKWEYTAYHCVADEIEEGTEPTYHWEAMDGNYNAENVYLNTEIKLSGNYTAVGNISKGSTSATGQTGSDGIPSFKNKNMKQILEQILSQKMQPQINLNPSCSVTLKQDGVNVITDTYYENGTEISGLTYSIGYTDGSYKIGGSKSQDAHCSASTYSVSGGSDTRTTASGSLSNITVSSTPYELKATVGYNQGDIAKDNMGGDSDPIIRIPSGTTTQATSSGKIKGYYRAFVAVYSDATATVNSDTIRANNVLANNNINNWTATTLSDVAIPSGTNKVVIASKNTELLEVLDSSVFDANIYKAFEKQDGKISIADASGSNVDGYTVWIYSPKSTLPNNTTYKIKLS